MHFTQAELKEIHDGLITLFGKKDSDIESLEGTPNASDTVVIMHNNINKKTTVGNLIGHDGPLAPVATSGDYDDLQNKPTIPAAQVNADWNAVSGKAQILNKPTIPTEQVNTDWNESDPSNKSCLLNKPDVKIYEASYIPYTKKVTYKYIAEHSKLHWDDSFPSICHTVILQEPQDFSNYNLTPYIAYYIQTLVTSKTQKDSIIKVIFTAFWNDENNTYFEDEEIKKISDKIYLYGKFYKGDVYQIASPKGKKTKCCITILSNLEEEREYFDIVCECLGSEIS